MVALKNIKVNKDEFKVFFDAYVEDCCTPVPVVFNMDSMSMGYKKLPEGYEWCSRHMWMAKKAVEEMLEVGEFPKQKIVMWC